MYISIDDEAYVGMRNESDWVQIFIPMSKSSEDYYRQYENYIITEPLE